MLPIKVKRLVKCLLCGIRYEPYKHKSCLGCKKRNNRKVVDSKRQSSRERDWWLDSI